MARNPVAKHDRNKGGMYKPKKGKGSYVREKSGQTIQNTEKRASAPRDLKRA